MVSTASTVIKSVVKFSRLSFNPLCHWEVLKNCIWTYFVMEHLKYTILICKYIVGESKEKKNVHEDKNKCKNAHVEFMVQYLVQFNT